MLPLLKSLLLSLALTLFLELSISFLVGLRKPNDFLLVFFVNLMTNPPVVLLFSLAHLFAFPVPFWLLMAVLELLVVSIEGFVYYKGIVWNRWNPFLLSLCLNAASLLGGFLLS